MTLMDHRGHAALHCVRFGHRNIFWFHSALPLKTLLSIAAAWGFVACNKIAAAIAVTLHDVVIWAMPCDYIAEYHLGLLELAFALPRVVFRFLGNSGCTII